MATELTGYALDRIANDHEPVPLDEWNLPTDQAGFLRVIDASGLPGASTFDRLQFFMRGPVARFMPAGLRDDLERADLLPGQDAAD